MQFLTNPQFRLHFPLINYYSLHACKISRWLKLITISSMKSLIFKFLYFKNLHEK